MIRQICPYCGTEIPDMPESGLCPECYSELEQKGNDDTTQIRRKLPWFFFFLTIVPYFLEWTAAGVIFIETGEDKDIGFILFTVEIICYCWLEEIMPKYSLFINNEKPPDRRTNRSGIVICVKTYLIMEFFLIVMRILWDTEYAQANKSVLMSYHFVSLYYLILAMLNIFFYDYTRYAGIYH